RPDVANWTEIKLQFGEGAGDYPARTSCENVVEKLRQTYEAMDAAAFTDCLADTFVFWLNEDDVISDPSLPWYWELQTESEIAWNMFGVDTNILTTYITLTQFGDPVEIPSQGGDESNWEYVYVADLWIYLPNDWAYRAGGAARFTLSVDPDATGPSGETLWEIVKWEDIHLEGALKRGTASGERVEESTWGGIKALYR
ncbi:hypothetical protein K8S17_05840, partial [bacterium]|nr:hypothetical protein [bacterium]